PWNWPKIPAQLLGGTLKAPLEVVTGQDSNQRGFPGAANAKKNVGGVTKHEDLGVEILRNFDLFEIFSKRVDPLFDFSQLPREVRLSSPLHPGESLSDKQLRAGKKDVDLGQVFIQK